MKGYVIVFGNTPELSWLEFKTVYPNSIRLSNHLAYFVENPEKVFPLVNLLGGFIKICSIQIEELNLITPQDILTAVEASNNNTYGISSVDSIIDVKSLLVESKELGRDRNLHYRYVEPKNQIGLSSVQIESQKITDIVIFTKNGKYGIAVTEYVQDYKTWSQRDYGRPYSDSKSGMLPIKVARMIVNITIGNLGSKSLKEIAICDPFCGMGTILSESISIGITKVIGADISLKAVKSTQQNLRWLMQKYSLKANVLTLESDATHLSEQVPPISVDAIITEPFMGNTQIGLGKLNKQKIKNIVKGLEKLYIGCLRGWHKILNNNGLIMISIPSFLIDGRIVFVKKVIDTCEKLGYTYILGPIEYSRPQAIVKRQFYLLKKQ